ncbi:acyltransferase family protein [Falsarthrobacter nasiphocae]|uniref:Peptidoglycan/LPS O-acetylase OafA/YrhL n=1 Tax=Falsarthrobacter nasiphocae TaxID=189863 RepID=A0AAE4C7H9_9MICC|nr:acyltransferase family protein [Falsarthrobacter nasiphocae]MDR6892569.1 peptidoglycan/LPS O-acetylase OafA/YrhL [Falsarthrobacter nasiphocae]
MPRRASTEPPASRGRFRPSGSRENGATRAAAARRAARPTAPTYRHEVQGLRAVALLMVVCYHIWFGRVSGGVDIFLMISAFFLTGSLARALDSGGSLNPFRRWSRQFRRLLPAAVVVILAVLVTVRWVFPADRWQEVAQQGLASATYWQNWLLAAQSVDYYAADHSLASPLQHFWSLSVQGQVFLLWPILALAVGLWARGRMRKPSRALFWVMAAIFVVSLGYSIYRTATAQGWAYFDTGARLYEFAFGGMLAIVVDRLRLPLGARFALGWAGLVAMLSCGFLVDVNGTFPGIVALWPVLAASAIIVAGRTRVPGSVDWLLTLPPVKALGDYSYAMYLWHWPVMITWLVVKGYDHVSPRAGLFIILVSLVLAWLTTRLVERPLRAWGAPERRPVVAGLVVAGLLAAAVLPSTLWASQLKADSQETVAIDASHPGAAALLEGYVDEVPDGTPLKPAMSVMPGQFASLPFACAGDHVPKTDFERIKNRCRTTMAADQSPSKGEVLIVGDSHAEQIMPVVVPYFTDRGYRVTDTILGGCRVAPSTGKDTEDCRVYNEEVRKYIRQVKPAYVVTIGTEAVADSPNEIVSDALVEVLREIAAEGTQVIAIRDNPRFSVPPVRCIQDNPDDPSACTAPRAKHIAADSALSRLKDVPGVTTIDLTDAICTPTECPAVVGNVIVYLDSHHLTKTYASSMAPAFTRAMEAQLEAEK